MHCVATSKTHTSQSFFGPRQWFLHERLCFVLLLCLGPGCGQSPERADAPNEEVVSVGGSTPTLQDDSPESTTARSPSPAPDLSKGSLSGEPAASVDGASEQYRMPKTRTAPEESFLNQHGLRRIESQRLLLITDSPDPELDQLPGIADQLFDTLVEWFGELPPAADGSDFQVLGHVMIDRGKFRKANLLPDEAFTIRHGRHLGYAFWAEYAETPYYRRHLALHEFVHCFMMCEHEEFENPPLWYIEGMAELFATHSVGKDASGLTVKFGVMPASQEGFEDWGRIRAFRDSFADADHQQVTEQKIPVWNTVVPNKVAVFESTFQYSSSWAVCWFLKHHPDALQLMPALVTERTYSDFMLQWERQFNDFGNRLKIDWLLFSEQLDFGFDADRSFPIHRRTTRSPEHSDTETMMLRADRGWQDSGVSLLTDEAVRIRCTGRCVMNETSEPWESTADGISIEYYRGHRLGQVVAVIVSEDGKRVTDRIPVGRDGVVFAAFPGRLWLQANDSSGLREDNSGEFHVHVERLP